MNKFTYIILSLALLVDASHAQDSAKTNQQKAKERRDAMLVKIQDDPALPRVLLLGDSISMMYTLPVRQLLAGKANVHRPPENCFYSANGVKKLDQWLGDKQWDVIHFNFGLHDNNYVDSAGKLVDVEKGKLVATPEAYGRNLRLIVERLKKTGAKLIFATTTPIPPHSLGRREGAEAAYNDVAAEIMRAEGVQINDLHRVVVERNLERLGPGNVHYTDASSQQLAEEVAAKIEAVLPKK